MSLETEYGIQSQLTSGERLLWTGRPIQGIVFRAADAFMIPFSLLWCGFAIFWEYSVISTDRAPLFFILWGVPFVAMGLYYVFGRFLVDARQRENTSYGVTDQRVIIVSGIVNRKTKSLSLGSLSDLSLTERPNGGGVISFGTSVFPAWWASGLPWPGMPAPVPAFELTGNARTVFELIRQAQGSAQRPS